MYAVPLWAVLLAVVVAKGSLARSFEERVDLTDVDICTLPKSITGPCRARIPMWSYDQSDGYCKQFVYGGCGGNGNRFESETECRTACNAKPPVDICTLPTSITGPCRAYFPMWTYDQSAGYCKDFVYGGCGGNGNRFESEADCRTACKAKPPVGANQVLETRNEDMELADFVQREEQANNGEIVADEAELYDEWKQMQPEDSDLGYSTFRDWLNKKAGKRTVGSDIHKVQKKCCITWIGREGRFRMHCPAHCN